MVTGNFFVNICMFFRFERKITPEAFPCFTSHGLYGAFFDIKFMHDLSIGKKYRITNGLDILRCVLVHG